MKRYRFCLIICVTLMVAILESCGVDNTYEAREKFMIEEFLDNDKQTFEAIVDNFESNKVGEGGIETVRDSEIMKEYGIPQDLIKKYRLRLVSIKYNEQNYCYEVSFETSLPEFEYAGIYYTTNGKPRNTEMLGIFDEDKQMYVNNQNDFVQYTQKLCENWFFYKCHWYRGL